MKNSACSNKFVSWIREPEDEYERECLIRGVEHLQRKVMYKKVEGGYKCYCTQCQAIEILPYKKLKMIRSARICWNCGSEIKTTTKTEGRIHDYISYDNVDGFYVEFGYCWDQKQRILIDHVIHYEGNTQYVRNVNRFMYSQVYAPEKSWWRKTRAYSDYYFYLSDGQRLKNGTLKRYYSLEDNVTPFKSNQRKFISQGVYNHNQMRYISFFDLNHPEEVERNNKYISKYSGVRLPQKGYKLNVHFLDYLSREGIPLPEYIDYVDNCLREGMKPQKPHKDAFWKLHNNIKVQIEFKKKSYLDPLIKARKDELTKYEYTKGNISIKVFDSVYKIIITGKELNNCIGTYCEKYGNNETNIFYGEVDNILNFALEEKDGHIIQVRANHNSTVSPKVKKFVKEWSSRNGFEYGG